MTAIGIDNNGALIFPYGKEDGDYRVEGDSSSGYAFNGAGSIFWRRLKNTFTSEIVEVMTQTDANCFNSEDLITEFDKFQNCFPEEIWRLDIERKYIRTFTGASVDNSVTAGKQNPRFLTSMMQGRKKYQRRQWVRDQGVYFNSKYRLSDITSNDNTIEFNCTTPADITNVAVTPSYYLQLTPFQDMYLNVQVGNGNYKSSYMTDGAPNLRAKAGQTYVFDLSGNYQETRIYINGANHLSAIGNLAPMYPYEFDLRALAHIKTLDIGTEVAAYTNTKFTKLELPNYMPLLESLNIKNCHSVAGTINLDTANNIRFVEATGTSIAGVSLPEYTNLEMLHIPSTVGSLHIYGARQLTDFKVFNTLGNNDYTSLFKLHVFDSDYNSEINWLTIASAILEKRSLETEISLLRLSTSTISNIQELEPYADFKTTLENAGGVLEFSGDIHVTGAWSTIEKATYESIWPVNLITIPNNEQRKYKVTYKDTDYVDDNGAVIPGPIRKEIYVNYGQMVPDIFSEGTLTEEPSRPSTVKKEYSFGNYDIYNNYVQYSGWSLDSLDGHQTPINQLDTIPVVTGPMTIYTYFVGTNKIYTIRWFLHEGDTTPVKMQPNIPYGGGESVEAPLVKEIHAAGYPTYEAGVDGGLAHYSIFKGWKKLPININPTNPNSQFYDIYGDWEESPSDLLASELFADTSTLTIPQLAVLAQSNYAITIDPGTRLVATLGHDNNRASRTQLINNVFNTPTTAASGPYNTNKKPLKANSAFTMMLDFSFDANVTYSTKSAVMLGSYEDSGNHINSLALYYNTVATNGAIGPTIGWGDWMNNSTCSVHIGPTGIRNIIVLRHPANSPILYIYSGYETSSSGTSQTGMSGVNSSSSITSEILETAITWSAPTSSNPPNLYFGHIYDSRNNNLSSSTITTFNNNLVQATGKIYNAVYWDEDLGKGECKRLAAWPHETITYAISAYRQNSSQGGPLPTSTVQSPSIGLTTMTASSYGQLAMSNQAGNTGWSLPSSPLPRALSNNRVLLGLPTTLQSILHKPPVKSYSVVTSEDQFGSISMIKNNYVDSTNDYIYFPSYSSYDVTNNTYATYYEETSPIFSFENGNNLYYSWLQDSNVTLYKTSGTNASQWIRPEGEPRFYYLNMRFPFKAIGRMITVFKEDISSRIPYQTTTIYQAITGTNEALTLKSGDIFVDSGNAAYMFITSEDMIALNANIEPGREFEAKSGSNTIGGWIKAKEYWLRSVFIPADSMGWGGSQTNFLSVNTVGQTELGSLQSNSDPRSLIYSFSI